MSLSLLANFNNTNVSTQGGRNQSCLTANIWLQEECGNTDQTFNHLRYARESGTGTGGTGTGGTG